jgi:choline dehydrogenase-like flavoprotein
VCRPKSRGFVALASSDPQAAPIIDPNLLAHEDDLEVLLRGYRLVDRLVQTDALRHYVSAELKPPRGRSKDELKAYLRQRSDDAYHPVGTCKMGNDPHAVVDAQLRVHGIDGLRVADASIMPTLIGGNTNAPTIMIGEKASDLIRGLNQGGEA